ncbi:MAG: hypothetical protein KGJ78_00545 [Alphaproteobacteria bacterium]|nr:hypothetical protein [Alphaproteobacteria bacterium]
MAAVTPVGKFRFGTYGTAGGYSYRGWIKGESEHMAAPRIQQDPAEGSEEVINRQLQRESEKGKRFNSAAASASDLRRLLGDIASAKVQAILAIKPTLADVEEARAWSEGDGDLLSKTGHPLTGKAAMIYDVLSAGQEDDRAH